MPQRKVTDTFPKRRVGAKAVSKRKKGNELDFDDITSDQKQTELPKLDSGSIESFRKALDTSSPSNLPCREAQISEIYDFLTEHLTEKKPGSLYISGAPGTGKTAVVNFVLNKIVEDREAENKKAGFHQLFVNCMCKRSATDIYELVLEKLKVKSATRTKSSSLKDKVREKLFTKSKSSYMM